MTNDGSMPAAERNARADTIVAYLIPPGFLLLAALFIWGAGGSDLPRSTPAFVERADFSSEPPRTLAADPPIMVVAGFDKKCSECHSLFMAPQERPMILAQHRDIVQAHGMNDRCYNCHDRYVISRLVLPGGETIAFGEATALCATCHGTTYRDWEAGMHGRTNGSWDPSSGRQTRLTCLQCHDPHAPAFGPMNALPGPETLRMGDPVEAAHGAPRAKRNPLRHWSGGGGTIQSDDHEDSK